MQTRAHERMVPSMVRGCGQPGTRLESLGDGQEASQSTFGLFEARARRWPSSRKTGRSAAESVVPSIFSRHVHCRESRADVDDAARPA